MKFETIKGESNSGKTTKCWEILLKLMELPHLEEIRFRLKLHNLSYNKLDDKQKIRSFYDEHVKPIKKKFDFFALVVFSDKTVLIYSESDCESSPDYLKGIIESFLVLDIKIDVIIHPINLGKENIMNKFIELEDFYKESVDLNNISKKKRKDYEKFNNTNYLNEVISRLISV